MAEPRLVAVYDIQVTCECGRRKYISTGPKPMSVGDDPLLHKTEVDLKCQACGRVNRVHIWPISAESIRS